HRGRREKEDRSQFAVAVKRLQREMNVRFSASEHDERARRAKSVETAVVSGGKTTDWKSVVPFAEPTSFKFHALSQ
ncbi:MAG: hypothetical protein ACK57G_10105, partial [Planctomycetota bacterium]